VDVVVFVAVVVPLDIGLVVVDVARGIWDLPES